MASRDNTEELVTPFLTVNQTIILPIATLSSMFLIYGMYMTIFGLCMHVLLHRHRSALRLYLVCTILLFVFATLFTASETFGETRQAIIYFRAAKTRNYEPLLDYWGGDHLETVWVTTASFAATFIKCADIMIIHRCYVLWGFSRIVLYILGGMGIILNGISLSTAFMGSIGQSNLDKFEHVYLTNERLDHGNMVAVAAFNGLLSRGESGGLAEKHVDTWNGPFAQGIEPLSVSCILFPAAMVTAMLVNTISDPNTRGIFPVDLSAIAYLMAGLAPTLIIVRVAHGKSVDSVQQVMSIHFAEQVSQQGTTFGPNLLQTTLDIHPYRRNDDDNARVEIDNPEEHI
ncbi:hypothetical protein PQX77_021980, partial [Marasmius sp. AFHP31]